MVKKATGTNHLHALDVVAIDIDDLTLDPANAREHSERSIAVIENSLKEFGQRKAIVVRKSGMVVHAGNGMVTAAKRLGWKQVAATVMDEDELRAVRYGLADNRTAELSSWNEVAARELLALPDIDVAHFGFTDEDQAQIFPALSGADVGEFPDPAGGEAPYCCPKCGHEWSGSAR